MPPLKDPTERAAAQKAAIKSLIDSGHFVTSDVPPGWTELRRLVWRKDYQKDLEREEDVKRDEPVEDFCNTGTVPKKTLVVHIPTSLPGIWKSHNRRILVRDEYGEAEKAALSADKDRGREAFLVTGHPGIGKTFFLLWLLMRRLALGLPTALQYDEDAFLFNEDSVYRFKKPRSSGTYDTLDSPDFDRIWALVDSNQGLTQPTGAFITGTPFFVVEAASPRIPRHQWLRKVNGELFYMKRWTFSEVLQARSFLGHSAPYKEIDLWDLYDKYGASPRALANYALRPAEYEGEVGDVLDLMRPSALQAALDNPGSDDSSHLIVATDPSPTSRTRHKSTIASRYILGELWNRYLANQLSQAKHFYYLFKDNTSTASAAGWLFEFRMHQLIRQMQTIRLYRIHGKITREKNAIYDDYNRSGATAMYMDVKLPESGGYPLKDGAQLQVGQYYRPEHGAFPAIDSLFYINHDGETSPILLMFQFTRNKAKHDAKEKGLERIDRLKLDPGARKYYVVVTPEGIEPQISVSKARVPGRNPIPDDLFPVYHYSVGEDVLFPGKAERPSRG